MPSRASAASRPKFDITVPTTPPGARTALALPVRATIQRTSSPSRIRPVSSAKIERSASPSNATPIAAPLSFVRARHVLGVERAAALVDVAAVGRDRRSRRRGLPRGVERGRAELEGGAVARVHDDRETRQVRRHERGEPRRGRRAASEGSARRRVGRRAASGASARLSRAARRILLERLLVRVRPLAAVGPEDLDRRCPRTGLWDAETETPAPARRARGRAPRRRASSCTPAAATAQPLSASPPASSRDRSAASIPACRRRATTAPAAPAARDAAAELAPDAPERRRVERELARRPAQPVRSEELHWLACLRRGRRRGSASARTGSSRTVHRDDLAPPGRARPATSASTVAGIEKLAARSARRSGSVVTAVIFARAPSRARRRGRSAARRVTSGDAKPGAGVAGQVRGRSGALLRRARRARTRTPRARSR